MFQCYSSVLCFSVMRSRWCAVQNKDITLNNKTSRKARSIAHFLGWIIKWVLDPKYFLSSLLVSVVNQWPLTFLWVRAFGVSKENSFYFKKMYTGDFFKSGNTQHLCTVGISCTYNAWSLVYECLWSIILRVEMGKCRSSTVMNFEFSSISKLFAFWLLSVGLSIWSDWSFFLHLYLTVASCVLLKKLSRRHT